MSQPNEQPTLFGHPTGLYTLFFAEMWERFSYYGMRALLTFYMIKGFLGYGDKEAYAVYGAYTSMVYMTPFFGGLIADRLVGPRKAVVLGGVLMAAGHLLMTLEYEAPFFLALALLIVGNGFFKPNISTMVGSMYSDGDPRRDGGFTLFYMGINLGAAAAPLLCGYVGENYGWHNGFGLATVGMLIGLAVFVVPNLVAQILILGGALLTAVSMVFLQESSILLAVNGLVAVALVISAGSAFMALSRGGLDPEIGKAPEHASPQTDAMVVGGALAVIPLIAGLVWSVRQFRLVSEDFVKGMAEGGTVFEIGSFFLSEVSTPPGLVLVSVGILAIGYLVYESVQAEKTDRERLWVILVMMFFSMLFWAFFEQGGTSLSNFADRNVDRVSEERVLTEADIGETVEMIFNQEQLGFTVNGNVMTMTVLDEMKKEAEGGLKPVAVKVDADMVGMGVGGDEVPASVFQSANPIFILLFGLVFSAAWSFLGRKNMEPSTPVKFALGLLQLGLGFAVLWYGASIADGRGMVGASWLVLGYLLHTTGELCLSPVGLSMVTRLSPARLVSTTMGAWFLATAFSSLLAGIIAALTGVGHGEGGGSGIPVPAETVAVYGGVFGQIALFCILSAVVMLALTPVLKAWAHEDTLPAGGGGGH